MALSAVLLAVAVVAGAPVIHDGEFLAVGWSIPWWLFALTFAVSEAVAVHIQVRREAQVVSVSELPLVVGLFLGAPIALLVGRLVGSLVVLVLHRRSPWLKTTFNTTMFCAQTSLALLLFRLMAESTDALPLQWLAALVATMAVNAFAAVLVAVVIWMYDDALPLSARLREAAASQAIVCGVVVLGLVAVNTLAATSGGPWLVAGAGTVLVLCYRAYASLFDRHVNLERLYRFSQSVTESQDTDAILRLVLDETRELLGSEYAELVLVSPTARPELVSVTLDPSGNPRRSRPVLVEALDWVHRLVVEDGSSVVLPRRSRDRRTAAWLEDHQLRDAAAVPLRSRDAVVGVLLVGDRLGDLRGFDKDDLLLLQTLANHASVAVQKGELIKRLQFDALHDPLTGLPNRTLLQRRLHEELTTGTPSPLAVMVLDLDGFKDVNDTLGHHQGDLALATVADRLCRAVARDGLVTRLGGDEFAVLVPGAGAVESAAVAERIVAALEEPITLEGCPVGLGASVGIALSPEHGTDGPTLLKGADLAMYEAKAGGMRMRFHEPEKDTTSTRRLTMVTALRSAVSEDDLDVVFQPQVDASSGDIPCFEALARWQHPSFGSVSPVEFIPLAERTGLMRPLTAAVLSRALGALAEWGRDGLSVAVNVSPRNLQDDDIVVDVQRALAATGLSPQALVVELTEGAVMADPDRAITLLRRFSDMGVRISIDDFGTGYSSLSYLKRLPLHEVKIDRSFVAGLTRSRQDLAIVRSVIELGSNFGLDVVAEGVEDLATFELLQSLGITRVQGWFVGRPMPQAQVAGWLADRPRPASPLNRVS